MEKEHDSVDKHFDPLLKDQSLVTLRSGETPYNVRETPKALDTKSTLETNQMAELIALGMVIIQGMKQWAIRG